MSIPKCYFESDSASSSTQRAIFSDPAVSVTCTVNALDSYNCTTSLQVLAFSKSQRSFSLNLNSLLVKRQNDNPSPGAVTGGNISPNLNPGQVGLSQLG